MMMKNRPCRISEMINKHEDGESKIGFVGIDRIFKRTSLSRHGKLPTCIYQILLYEARSVGEHYLLVCTSIRG